MSRMWWVGLLALLLAALAAAVLEVANLPSAGYHLDPGGKPTSRLTAASLRLKTDTLPPRLSG